MIQQARDSWAASYGNLKGVVGVCSKSFWNPGGAQTVPDVLQIYIQSPYVMDLLPASWEGYTCEFVVVPNGIHPGCD